MNCRILIVMLFTGCVSTVQSAVLPTGQPEYEFIYDRWERESSNNLDLFDYQLGPFEMDSTRFEFGPFREFIEASESRLNVFSIAAEDFSVRQNALPAAYESVTAGALGHPHRNVFVYGNFSLDEALADDPGYYGKEWRGLAGDVRDAFVHVTLGNLRATVGRFSSFWGIRNSMLLSAGSHLDGLAYTYRWGRVAISYRLARLDGMSPERDSVTQFENRFFAAHRFDFHLSNRVRLGLFEAVIFGGPGRQIDLFYLNPLLFFHGSQLNEGSDDNTVVGFDFTLKPTRGIRLFGQLLVDDFQIEKKTQGDQEPDQYAAVVGAYTADVLPSVDVRLEYSRVTNWTFNQNLERNRYLHNGDPIGAARGNDYDRMDLSVIYWLDSFFSGRFNLAYQRQGEGRITDEWTNPWLDTDGDYDEDFPTGVTEKRFTASTGVRGFLRSFLFVDLEAGANIIRNTAHISGDDRTQPFITLRLSTVLNSILQLD